MRRQRRTSTRTSGVCGVDGLARDPRPASRLTLQCPPFGPAQPAVRAPHNARSASRTACSVDASGFLGAVPDRRADVARRRRNLLLAAGAAFVLGVVVGGASGDGGDDPQRREGVRGASVPSASAPVEPAPVDRLTLRQQVVQLIVMRFAGTTAPGYVRAALRDRRAAGVILFRDNVAGPEQLRALTAALRRAAAGDRPIVAVDQEGGDIRIVPWAPPDAAAAASALRSAGITVGLAPVGDVPSVDGAALGGRAFSDDPEEAGRAIAAAVEGWRAGGVAATAKHFPGLGGATVNTDDAPASIERSRAQLDATDLPPFEAAIDAGVPLVMIGHARYPALDPNRIASQSEAIVGGLLRTELGFRGVVVTDSLEAEASLAT